MTTFDTDARALMGEDCRSVIREFVESGVVPDSPLSGMARQYIANGAGFGELETALLFASLCDTIGTMDARLKAIDRREDSA